MILLNKIYDSESIIDLEGDVNDLFADSDIPQDENGFMLGEFHVTVEWVPE